MAGDHEALIRERAHEIWLSEGRPEGKHLEHWERAAREVDQTSVPGNPPVDIGAVIGDGCPTVGVPPETRPRGH